MQTTDSVELHDADRYQLTVLDVLAGELPGMYSLPSSECPFIHSNRHGLARDLVAGRIDADDLVVLTTDEALRVNGRASRSPSRYDLRRP